MAVWQYQLNIIPKKAILEKYGSIPNELLIDHDGWEKYWENVNFDNGFPEPDFEDAKTIKWWTNTKFDIRKATEQIDKLVSRGDWNDDEDSGFIGWKGDSDKLEDNDAHIAYDKKTNVISEFQFRTDLRKRENITEFLNGMLNLCEQNDLMIFNTDGILFEPKSELIYENLKKSNAVEFLTDPEKFLEKIAERENKMQPKKVSFWSKIKTYFE
tara:strand:- start:59 stop:697 length:639 start_codon:yes stop_codon:yes gene_type:complete